MNIKQYNPKLFGMKEEEFGIYCKALDYLKLNKQFEELLCKNESLLKKNITIKEKYDNELKLLRRNLVEEKEKLNEQKDVLNEIGKCIGKLRWRDRDFVVLNAFGETEGIVGATINMSYDSLTTIELEKEKIDYKTNT